MLRLQAYKFELEPNGEQRRAMRRHAGAYRFVFNRSLARGYQNHADLVGSINGLRAGRALLACQAVTSSATGTHRSVSCEALCLL